MDEQYNLSVDILTNAIKQMGDKGVTKDDILPTLIDFTATIAVALGGEEAMKACILRFIDRIKDLNDGTFPVDRPVGGPV